MIVQQRYLARFVGPRSGVPVYAIGCPGSSSGPVSRVLARFLGLKGGVPVYGYSTCEFPRIGRYLMRFVGMMADNVPVYALGCCLEGSSGVSGSSGESGSSGCSCPEYPWETEAFHGASWSGDGWSVRIDFEDSQNCGGVNNLIQYGNAMRRVCLCAPHRLTVNMIGWVETQNIGFEYAETRVNDQLIAAGSSTQEGGGCDMTPATASGSIDLPAGEHQIRLYSSTNDPMYHIGAYWEFHFTLEPL